MPATPLPHGADPTAGPLVDSFGRVANDLRISVTDRCNLRCVYCMPAEGLPWLERSDLLTYEEIGRLASLFVDLGVRTIRLTGGEPLVRRDLPRLVEQLAALSPRPELALTTNGVLLERQAESLAAAGLDRVNVSLDSLQPERFAEITRRDELGQVLAGLAAARAAELDPLKLNCVVMRGRNDDEIAAFADFAREQGCAVRFIEYMPLDANGRWTDGDVVAAREILNSLEEAGEHPVAVADPGPEPATRYRLADGGEIGVIPSVTAPFCTSCNRVRLSAEGTLRNCLFALDETDLLTPLRAGASDAEIVGLVRASVAAKWAGHGIGRPGFEPPSKSMSQIGG